MQETYVKNTFIRLSKRKQPGKRRKCGCKFVYYHFDRLMDIGREDTLEGSLQKAQKVKEILANDNTPWAGWSKKRADDEIAG
ncbi:MAG: hypothetical protein ACL7BU_16100 [Candidatus Phlomobacter fragariae]